LFLGGYNIPFVSETALREIVQGWGFAFETSTQIAAVILFATFVAKIGFFMWVFVWVRWTLPRFRYDQLMDLGWKILLPLGVFNVIGTLVFTYFKKTGAI
jgi:NADH-quinone oxidoreductase subunit H